MQRTFTVELTAAEALTVHRVAKLSRVPVERIVQNFYQAGVLSALTALSTGGWLWYDERTDTYIRDRRRSDEHFATLTASFMRGVRDRGAAASDD